MKHKYKFILIALAGALLTYAGCSKLKDDGSTPNTSTISAKQMVSAQLAPGLSEALYGGQGGFSISDGIDYPSNIDFKAKGKAHIESIKKFGCGFKIDTTFSVSFGDSDTSKLDIWEKIKYELLCTNSIPSSVNVADSVNLTIVGGGNNIVEKYGKSYLLKSLSPGQTNAKLQLDGKLNEGVSGKYVENKTSATIAATFNFNLSTLVIDRSKDADIISGSATFSTKGTIGKDTWNYSGKIDFLGGHKAKITINSEVININIKTGQVL